MQLTVGARVDCNHWSCSVRHHSKNHALILVLRYDLLLCGTLLLRAAPRGLIGLPSFLGMHLHQWPTSPPCTLNTAGGGGGTVWGHAGEESGWERQVGVTPPFLPSRPSCTPSTHLLVLGFCSYGAVFPVGMPPTSRLPLAHAQNTALALLN